MAVGQTHGVGGGLRSDPFPKNFACQIVFTNSTFGREGHQDAAGRGGAGEADLGFGILGLGGHGNAPLRLASGVGDDDLGLPQEPVDAAEEVDVVEEEAGAGSPAAPLKDKVEWANAVSKFNYYPIIIDNLKTLRDAEASDNVIQMFLDDVAGDLSKTHGIEITGADLAKVMEGK